MKYNAHIYCNFYKLTNFCFVFVLMQSLKTSPADVGIQPEDVPERR